MTSAKDWAAKKPKKKGTEYVVEHKVDGQTRVSVYPSKKRAHEVGMEIRRAGGTAFAHDVGTYKKFVNPTWDGKASEGGADERDRDELGRFA